MKAFERNNNAASVSAISVRIPRHVSGLEKEIRQLYLTTIDEPIPPRLMAVLRAGLAS